MEYEARPRPLRVFTCHGVCLLQRCRHAHAHRISKCFADSFSCGQRVVNTRELAAVWERMRRAARFRSKGGLCPGSEGFRQDLGASGSCHNPRILGLGMTAGPGASSVASGGGWCRVS